MIPNVLSSLNIFKIIKTLYIKNDTDAIKATFISEDIKSKLANQLKNKATKYKLETFFDVKRYRIIKIGSNKGLTNH